MARVKFFSIDTRIRDVNGKVRALHFCRTLDEDEPIIVADDSFRPYSIVKHPFDEPYEKMRDKILSLWESQRESSIYIRKVELSRLDKKIEAARVEFDTLTDFFEFKRMIKQKPESYIESYRWASVKKRYFIQRNLLPMTVWEAELTIMPMQGRVKAYIASELIQKDKMQYSNPDIMSFSFFYDGFMKKILLDSEPVSTSIFHTSKGCRVITWKRSGAKADCQVEHLQSEIDMIERWSRVISSEKPIILAGHNSDEIDFPRIIRRSEKYSESANRGRIDFSDDFSNPYKTRLGMSVHGFVHLDLKKTTEALNGIKGFEYLSELLDDMQMKSAASSLLQSTNFEMEVDSTRAMHSAARKIYPLYSELSTLCMESFFDLSRYEPGRIFLSYYETNCLMNGIYYDEAYYDENDYTIPGPRDFYNFEGESSTRATAMLQFRFYYALEAASKNMSRETLNCKCCKKENERVWFCEKRNSQLKGILKALTGQYARYKGIINDLSPEALKARLAAYEMLLLGFENAMANRRNPLYLPEAAGILAKNKEILLEEIMKQEGTIAASGNGELFFDGKKKVKDFMLSKLSDNYSNFVEGTSYFAESIGLAKSIIVKRLGEKRISYAYYTGDYDFKSFGFRSRSQNLCELAVFLRDMLLRKMMDGNSKEEIKDYFVKKLIKFYRGDFDLQDIIITTTLYKELSEYKKEAAFVIAAEKLKSLGYEIVRGSKIAYIMALNEDNERDVIIPEGIINTQNIDLEYYIRRQILKAAMPILNAAGIDEEEAKDACYKARTLSE